MQPFGFASLGFPTAGRGMTAVLAMFVNMKPLMLMEGAFMNFRLVPTAFIDGMRRLGPTIHTGKMRNRDDPGRGRAAGWTRSRFTTRGKTAHFVE